MAVITTTGPNLQAAINSAASGDTINVTSGTSGGIDINKRLIIDGKGASSINGVASNGSSVRIRSSAGGTTLKNFTSIKGATIKNSAVVLVEQSSDVIIQGNNIEDGAQYGIRTYEADRTTIENNVIRRVGVGIAVTRQGNGHIIRGNTLGPINKMLTDDGTDATNGGNGIQLYDSGSNVLIEGNHFISCRAQTFGGVSWAYDGGAIEPYGVCGSTIIRGNDMRDCVNFMETGTDASHPGQPTNFTIEDNEIWGTSDVAPDENKSCIGLFLRANVGFTIRRNKIHELDDFFIILATGGTYGGQASGNTITDNDIWVKPGNSLIYGKNRAYTLGTGVVPANWGTINGNRVYFTPATTPEVGFKQGNGATNNLATWQGWTGWGVGETWNAAASGFKVYRGGVLINGNATSPYVDTGLTNGQQYSYQVSAFNSFGEGPKAGPVTATPFATGNRPFAAPTTTGTYNIPGTIDASGNTDVTSVLQSFLNSVPNGSVINFPANGSYRMTSGILVSGRNNLVFQGNGSRIHTYGAGNNQASSAFYFNSNNSSDIAIHNFKLQTNNTNTTDVYNPGTEYAMGVALYSGNRIEIANCTVTNTFGDGIYFAGSSQNTWAHNNIFDYIGRMGMAFIATNHCLVESNTFNHVGLIQFDIEPNDVSEVLNDIKILNNSVGFYSMSGYQTNFFLAYATPKGSLSSLLVQGNNVTGGAGAVNTNNAAGKGGLFTNIQHARVNGLQFKNNTTTVPGKNVNGYPSPLYFLSVDGLVVTGNTQPFVSGFGGPLVTASDCPGAITSPNP